MRQVNSRVSDKLGMPNVFVRKNTFMSLGNLVVLGEGRGREHGLPEIRECKRLLKRTD